MSDKSDKRHTIVAGMLPADWDQKPFGLAGEIRAFLGSVKDEGTEIDSGSGDGCADLWVTVQGVEYFISVRKSNKQLVREGKLPTPSTSLMDCLREAINAKLDAEIAKAPDAEKDRDVLYEQLGSIYLTKQANRSIFMASEMGHCHEARYHSQDL